MPRLNSNHILIGLGGTGGRILKAFKKRMFQEYPDADDRKKTPVALLYVDTDREMMSKDGRPLKDFMVMGQDASFTENEFLYIKDVDVNGILDHPDRHPSLGKIVENADNVRLSIGNIGTAAGQKRRAGRIMFAANAGAFRNKLESMYNEVSRVSGIGDEEKMTFHIFAGLSGGTGSGAVIDSIIQTRKRYPQSKILVYVMLPERILPKSDMDQGRYYPNGYAAINELNALQSDRFHPQDVTTGRKSDSPTNFFSGAIKGVADGLYVYSDVNENGFRVHSLDELPGIVSDFIYARIFMVKEGEKEYKDLIRSFNLENMDNFSLEFDELADPESPGKIPAARTKKISSFGIKRVMYPQRRIEKHITYTVGEGILNQIKYNNWKENKGYQSEDRGMDFGTLYFKNKELLSNWKVDLDHLMLDKKILPSDPDIQSFAEYWNGEKIAYLPTSTPQKDPLSTLELGLNKSFTKENGEISFRGLGVEEYFNSKRGAIREMAHEIRKTVEKDLFNKWRNGDISVTELERISGMMLNYLDGRDTEGNPTGMRNDIDTELVRVEQLINEIQEEKQKSINNWSNRGPLRIVAENLLSKREQHILQHAQILEQLYVEMTRKVALGFAKNLVERLIIEMKTMNDGIGEFARKINEIIKNTDSLIVGQRKVNKGLEDLTGVIVETSDEDKIVRFEELVKIDNQTMPVIARDIRCSILPEGDFRNFDQLASQINPEKMKRLFDMELAQRIESIHDKIPTVETKVLGLNVLQQLRQQLRTDEDIRAFAFDIVQQSGVFLQVDENQMRIHLPNNENDLSPENSASVNKKVIVVLIPAVDKDDKALQEFADTLVTSFARAFPTQSGRTSLFIDRNSPRKNELSIISLRYCFPLRAIKDLKDYKERYADFLNTGNKSTDMQNSILLHSEGDGKDFPSLFAIEDTEEIRKEREKRRAANGINNVHSTMPPVPSQTPSISVHAYINGQPVGPIDYNKCEELFKLNQLTKDTLVWKEGMANWTPAGQVKELEKIFAPKVPPVMPGMPPVMPGMAAAAPGMPPAGPGMPPVMPDPVISLSIWYNGQSAGPYDYTTCRQFVDNGFLTKETFVWKQGLPSWTPAGQVPELAPLFAPKMPPAGPGMPPAGPGMPPAGPGMPGMPPAGPGMPPAGPGMPGMPQ